MRRLVRAAAMLVAVSALCAAYRGRDESSVDPVLAPLKHGTLLVWVVYPARAKIPPAAATAYSRYSEQTAGSFGQAASDVGTNAGNTGQSPSTLGASTSSNSRNAGDVGQTAGSFGVSSSDLPAVAAANNGSIPTLQLVTPVHDRAWDGLEHRLREEFPELQVTFVDVSADDLRLRLVGRTGAEIMDDRFLLRMSGRGGPDVLLGSPLAAVSRLGGMMSMGIMPWIEQTEASDGPGVVDPDAAVSSRAAHAEEARAFVVWLRDQGNCAACRSLARESDKPASVAVEALRSVLNGNGLGDDADRQAATFSAQTVQIAALGANVTSAAPTSMSDLRIDVSDAQANDRFAVVELRAVALRGAPFVAHAVVVLRTDDSGTWRVLQISPNLRPEQQETAWSQLEPFGHGAEAARVAGISEAAPVDGDNRSPRPDLWWDNIDGGARLQVVEWQMRGSAGWTASNLYFVPDDHFRERTRVNARFAKTQGTYRWRIWSVGIGGAVVLSPWRVLNILPR
jgi:hypothetical protein